MSEWKNATGRARKALQKQPDSLAKRRELSNYDAIDTYLSNMVVEQLGTFRAPRVYRKFDTPAVKADGTIDDSKSRDVYFALCRVIDRNDRSMTGRRYNTYPGAYESRGFGTTTSYVVVPLEDLSKDRKTTTLEFKGEDNKDPDLSGATRVFDPRLVALSTYPQEIADAAKTIRSIQEGAFTKNYDTVNTDHEHIDFASDYWQTITKGAYDAYLESLERNTQQDDTPEE